MPPLELLAETVPLDPVPLLPLLPLLVAPPLVDDPLEPLLVVPPLLLEPPVAQGDPEGSAQVPPQQLPEQQSPGALHPLPSPAQHTPVLFVPVVKHRLPLQHWAGAVQLPPGATQLQPPSWHVPVQQSPLFPHPSLPSRRQQLSPFVPPSQTALPQQPPLEEPGLHVSAVGLTDGSGMQQTLSVPHSRPAQQRVVWPSPQLSAS